MINSEKFRQQNDTLITGAFALDYYVIEQSESDGTGKDSSEDESGEKLLSKQLNTLKQNYPVYLKFEGGSSNALLRAVAYRFFEEVLAEEGANERIKQIQQKIKEKQIDLHCCLTDTIPKPLQQFYNNIEQHLFEGLTQILEPIRQSKLVRFEVSSALKDLMNQNKCFDLALCLFMRAAALASFSQQQHGEENQAQKHLFQQIIHYDQAPDIIGVCDLISQRLNLIFSLELLRCSSGSSGGGRSPKNMADQEFNEYEIPATEASKLLLAQRGHFIPNMRQLSIKLIITDNASQVMLCYTQSEAALHYHYIAQASPKKGLIGSSLVSSQHLQHQPQSQQSPRKDTGDSDEQRSKRLQMNLSQSNLNQISELQQSVAKLEDQVRQLQLCKQSLEHKLLNKQTLNDNLKKDFKELSFYLINIQQKYKTQISQLSQEIDTLKQQKSIKMNLSFQSENPQLQQQQQQSSSQPHQVRSASASARSSYQFLRNANSLGSSFSFPQEQLAAMDQEIHIKELIEKNKRLSEDKESLSEELKQYKSLVSEELPQELEESLKHQEEVRQQNSDLLRQLAEMKEALLVGTQRMSDCEQENQTLKAQIVKDQLQIDELEVKFREQFALKQLQDEAQEQLSSQVQEHLQNCEQNFTEKCNLDDQQNLQLSEDNTRLNTEIANLREQLNEVQLQLQLRVGQVDTLEQEVIELQEVKDALRMDNSELLTRLAQYDQENLNYKQMMDDQLKKIEKNNRDQINLLQIELEKWQQMYSDVNQKGQESEREHLALRNEMEEINNRFQDLQLEKELNNAEILKLHSDLKKSNSLIEALKQQIVQIGQKHEVNDMQQQRDQHLIEDINTQLLIEKENTIQKLQVILQQANTERAKAEQVIQDLIMEKQQHQSQISEVANEELQIKLKEVEQELILAKQGAELKDSLIYKLDQEFKEQQQILKDAMQQNEKLKLDNQIQQDQLMLLNEEKQLMEQQLKEKTLAIQQNYQTNQEKDNQIQQMETKLQINQLSNQNQLEEQQNNNQFIAVQLLDRTAQLVEKDKEIESFNAKCNALDQENKSLQSKINELEEVNAHKQQNQEESVEVKEQTANEGRQLLEKQYHQLNEQYKMLIDENKVLAKDQNKLQNNFNQLLDSQIQKDKDYNDQISKITKNWESKLQEKEQIIEELQTQAQQLMNQLESSSNNIKEQKTIAEQLRNQMNEILRQKQRATSILENVNKGGKDFIIPNTYNDKRSSTDSNQDKLLDNAFLTQLLLQQPDEEKEASDEIDEEPQQDSPDNLQNEQGKRFDYNKLLEHDYIDNEDASNKSNEQQDESQPSGSYSGSVSGLGLKDLEEDEIDEKKVLEDPQVSDQPQEEPTKEQAKDAVVKESVNDDEKKIQNSEDNNQEQQQQQQESQQQEQDQQEESQQQQQDQQMSTLLIRTLKRQVNEQEDQIKRLNSYIKTLENNNYSLINESEKAQEEFERQIDELQMKLRMQDLLQQKKDEEGPKNFVDPNDSSDQFNGKSNHEDRESVERDDIMEAEKKVNQQPDKQQDTNDNIFFEVPIIQPSMSAEGGGEGTDKIDQPTQDLNKENNFNEQMFQKQDQQVEASGENQQNWQEEVKKDENDYANANLQEELAQLKEKLLNLEQQQEQQSDTSIINQKKVIQNLTMQLQETEKELEQLQKYVKTLEKNNFNLMMDNESEQTRMQEEIEQLQQQISDLKRVSGSEKRAEQLEEQNDVDPELRSQNIKEQMEGDVVDIDLNLDFQRDQQEQGGQYVEAHNIDEAPPKNEGEQPLSSQQQELPAQTVDLLQQDSQQENNETEARHVQSNPPDFSYPPDQSNHPNQSYPPDLSNPSDQSSPPLQTVPQEQGSKQEKNIPQQEEQRDSVLKTMQQHLIYLELELSTQRNQVQSLQKENEDLQNQITMYQIKIDKDQEESATIQALQLQTIQELTQQNNEIQSLKMQHQDQLVLQKQKFQQQLEEQHQINNQQQQKLQQANSQLSEEQSLEIIKLSSELKLVEEKLANRNVYIDMLETTSQQYTLKIQQQQQQIELLQKDDAKQILMHQQSVDEEKLALQQALEEAQQENIASQQEVVSLQQKYQNINARLQQTLTDYERKLKTEQAQAASASTKQSELLAIAEEALKTAEQEHLSLTSNLQNQLQESAEQIAHQKNIIEQLQTENDQFKTIFSEMQETSQAKEIKDEQLVQLTILNNNNNNSSMLLQQQKEESEAYQQIQQLEETNQNQLQQLLQQGQQLADFEKRINLLNEELDQMDRAYKAMQQSNEEMAIKKQIDEEALIAIQQNLEAVQEQQQKKDQEQQEEVQRLNAQYEVLTSLILQKESELETLRAEAQTLRETNNQFALKNEDLIKQKQQAEKNFEQTENALQQAEKNIEKAIASVQAQRQLENEQLIHQLEEQNLQLQNLTQQIDEKELQIQSQEQEIERLKNNIKLVQENFAKSITEEQAKAASATLTKVQKLEIALAELQNKYNQQELQTETVLKQRNAEIDNLKAQQRQGQQLKELQENQLNSVLQFISTTALVNKQEQSGTSAQKSMESLIVELNIQTKSLAEQIKKERNRIVQLEQQLKSKEQDIQYKEQLIKSIDIQRKSVTEENVKKESEMTQLQDIIAKQKQEINDIQLKLENQQKLINCKSSATPTLDPKSNSETQKNYDLPRRGNSPDTRVNFDQLEKQQQQSPKQTQQQLLSELSRLRQKVKEYETKINQLNQTNLQMNKDLLNKAAEVDKLNNEIILNQQQYQHEQQKTNPQPEPQNSSSDVPQKKGHAGQTQSQQQYQMVPLSDEVKKDSETQLKEIQVQSEKIRQLMQQLSIKDSEINKLKQKLLTTTNSQQPVVRSMKTVFNQIEIESAQQQPKKRGSVYSQGIVSQDEQIGSSAAVNFNDKGNSIGHVSIDKSGSPYTVVLQEASPISKSSDQAKNSNDSINVSENQRLNNSNNNSINGNNKQLQFIQDKEKISSLQNQLIEVKQTKYQLEKTLKDIQGVNLQVQKSRKSSVTAENNLTSDKKKLSSEQMFHIPQGPANTNQVSDKSHLRKGSFDRRSFAPFNRNIQFEQMQQHQQAQPLQNNKCHTPNYSQKIINYSTTNQPNQRELEIPPLVLGSEEAPDNLKRQRIISETQKQYFNNNVNLMEKLKYHNYDAGDTSQTRLNLFAPIPSGVPSLNFGQQLNNQFTGYNNSPIKQVKVMHLSKSPIGRYVQPIIHVTQGVPQVMPSPPLAQYYYQHPYI